MKKFMAVIALVALAGCQTMTQEPVAEAPQQGARPQQQVAQQQQPTRAQAPQAPRAQPTPAVLTQPTANACVRPGQANCLEIVALNGKYVAGKHDGFRTKVAWEEHIKRAPAFWKAYHAGQEEAAGPRSFDIIIYSTNQNLPTGDIAVWRANSRTHIVSRMRLMEVTHMVQLPTASMALGTARVFRITADGNEPFVASIQLPYEMAKAINYVTVCATDERTVVPNRVGKANESYGISKETLAWFVDKGHKRLPLLHLSPM